MNSIIITGRIRRGPEIRYSPEGTAWATVSVAEGGDDPNWFDVKCFKRTPEVLNEYGSKGRKVAVQGRMVQESYEKDGETRKVWRLIANRIEFLDSPNGGGEPEAESDPPYQAHNSPHPTNLGWLSVCSMQEGGETPSFRILIQQYIILLD